MSYTLPDMTPIFARYEALMVEADALFQRVRSLHPECVACDDGCSECCEALFDLPLIEAVYLSSKYRAAFPPGPERSALLQRADSADRNLQRIKRKAFTAEKAGQPPEVIMADIARQRVACPLLAPEGTSTPASKQASADSAPPARRRCLLYACRPVTCRLYGIPTAIGGKAYTCGLSHFSPGQAYPTVAMEAIHQRLADLSRELAHHTGAGYAQVHEVYVPVSMALLTSYDAQYFGVDKNRGAAHGDRA